MPWHLLRSGSCDYALNMALDEVLLESVSTLGKPVLRFYGWKQPAASFGYFQKFTDVERLTLLRPLVRRPTGGGIVPHDADWTYSLSFPPMHEWYALAATESYRRVHDWVRLAFAELGIAAELAPAAYNAAAGQCFAGYERSDVLWHGRKVAGAAQRRTRAGLLIQGSVQPPPVNLSRECWESAMLSVAENRTVRWLPLPENSPILLRAEQLASEKFSQQHYNRKR